MTYGRSVPNSDSSSPHGANFDTMLRVEAEDLVARVLSLQHELVQARRELGAINVLLEARGQKPVPVPPITLSQNYDPPPQGTANRFGVQMPPRRSRYQNMIYRDAVVDLLKSGGEMTADELTRAVFEDCSEASFKLAKNALIGAISTDVRSGLFERPRRSTFRMNERQGAQPEIWQEGEPMTGS